MQGFLFIQMKEKPGVRTLATVLQQELMRRFEKVLSPGCASFEPVYVEATLLDPRFKIVLNYEQLEAAKLQLLRDVSYMPSDTVCVCECVCVCVFVIVLLLLI